MNIKPGSQYENFRLSDGSFIIENAVTDEYVKFVNIDESKPGIISFDVELSNGLKLENLNLAIPPSDPLGSANSRTSGVPPVLCPWCWVGIVVLDAILDSLDDDSYSICTLALVNCANAGGVAQTESTEGGWFSAGSCSVKCELPD